MSETCSSCPKLKAVAAELVLTIENLLQANRDAAAPGGLGPFLFEIHRLGLKATLANVRANLAEIELSA